MQKIKENGGTFVTLLAELLVGILLLLDPLQFTSAIIIILGILMALAGIAGIIQYFSTDALLAARENQLAKGLVLLCLGLFCTFRSKWFIQTFPLLTILYGAAILLTGLSKLQWTVDMLRLKMQNWWMAALAAVLTLAFAVVILINPFASTTALWRFTAIILLVQAVLDLAALILVRQKDPGDQSIAGN